MHLVTPIIKLNSERHKELQKRERNVLGEKSQYQSLTSQAYVRLDVSNMFYLSLQKKNKRCTNVFPVGNPFAWSMLVRSAKTLIQILMNKLNRKRPITNYIWMV